MKLNISKYKQRYKEKRREEKYDWPQILKIGATILLKTSSDKYELYVIEKTRNIKENDEETRYLLRNYNSNIHSIVTKSYIKKNIL